MSQWERYVRDVDECVKWEVTLADGRKITVKAISREEAEWEGNRFGKVVSIWKVVTDDYTERLKKYTDPNLLKGIM